MFRDFTQFRDNSSTRPRPPCATHSQFTKHPDIDTTESELLTASINSRLLSRLVLASALCPVHTITQSHHINSTSPQWRLSARSAQTYSSSLQNKDENKAFFRTRRNVSKQLRATHQRIALFEFPPIRTRATAITQPTQQYVWLSTPQAVAHQHDHPVSTSSLRH